VAPTPAPVATERNLELPAEGGDEAVTVSRNRRRAAALCLVPGIVVGLVVGAVLAGAGLPVVGIVLFVVLAACLALGLWWRAPGVVVRAVGARPSDEADQPRLHNLVDGLCATMGLPRPRVCVVDSPVPNAMVVGRDPDSATLVVTTALDRTLSLVELEGVLAHELVHVKRHDMTVAGPAVLVSVPLSFVGGMERGSERVHRFVGRGREFAADQRAAAVVRYPAGIGGALETMTARSTTPSSAAPWPPGRGQVAALTRWLWIDPLAGAQGSEPLEGNLDDTRVRAEALTLY
jgi:Zn-dependent protease with chaperone function